ncbi:uncharacterized protein EDB91DRAFT_1244629 [Suillus paluster]|uniref:uncharacterized protein n=1 Tax=Suillus paluster TaxID=48578 RepID=UPI001B87EA5F|nr:uncharacterized protein EDB91DRAFT_1244629 [Suillus paluster]KAG1750036.1 hypothetical protein EDB91DRAFT_1244629 [Suillus paluster]
MVVLKLKKIFNSSRQRVKASDFDEISKEILGTVTSIFRCLIVTRAPFPDGVAVEMRLAKEAWHEACEIKGIQVKLTPPAVKMLLLRISHEVIRKNRDLAESLKGGSAFAFKDWMSKTGIYKSELLQDSINIMWFANQNDEGIIYHKYFNPIPVEVVALVLTAIECCIDEWLQGLKEDIKFTLATYASIYQAHFDSLQCFHKHMAPYKLLERLCDSLHDRARCRSTVIYRIRVPPVPSMSIPTAGLTPCFPVCFIPPSLTMHEVHLSRISPATSTRLCSALPTLPLCPPTPYPFHPTLSGVPLLHPIGPPNPTPTPSAFLPRSDPSVPLVLTHPTISPSNRLTGPLLD